MKAFYLFLLIIAFNAPLRSFSQSTPEVKQKLPKTWQCKDTLLLKSGQKLACRLIGIKYNSLFYQTTDTNSFYSIGEIAKVKPKNASLIRILINFQKSNNQVNLVDSSIYKNMVGISGITIQLQGGLTLLRNLASKNDYVDNLFQSFSKAIGGRVNYTNKAGFGPFILGTYSAYQNNELALDRPSKTYYTLYAKRTAAYFVARYMKRMMYSNNNGFIDLSVGAGFGTIFKKIFLDYSPYDPQAYYPNGTFPNTRGYGLVGFLGASTSFLVYDPLYFGFYLQTYLGRATMNPTFYKEHESLTNFSFGANLSYLLPPDKKGR